MRRPKDNIISQFDLIWDKYATVWKDIELLTTSVSEWCPAGWQAHKAKIVSTKEVARSLLSNVYYPKVGPAVAALQAMVRAAKLVRTRDNSPVISANVVKDASGAATLGLETVAITFALFQATTTLPQQTNAKVRATMVEKLEAEVSAKKVELGEELAALIAKLKDPEFKPEPAGVSPAP